MAVDSSAFIVVPVEATVPVLWRAMRSIRTSLNITRIYWHPDEHVRDGCHFRLEVPVAQLQDPATARGRIQSILVDHGAALL